MTGNNDREHALVQLLNDTGSADVPGEFEAMLIKHELESLYSGQLDAGDLRRDLFLRLCNLAETAFSGTPEDDLLDNAAARPLLSYLLRALRRYRSSVNITPVNSTTDARAALAEAFFLTGRVGAPHGVSVEIQMEVCSAFSRAREAAVDAMSEPLPNAEAIALRAAFETRYGRSYDKTIDSKLMNELRVLLAIRGYLWGPGHSAWTEN
ncbi:hypothetical protein [Methylibium sp.]|jgi:hypothetical protein|uniref:hypothetical protein n=1 Tax=Methylibium sp. TaxID=2067992 RepID=UPI003F700FC5